MQDINWLGARSVEAALDRRFGMFCDRWQKLLPGLASGRVLARATTAEIADTRSNASLRIQNRGRRPEKREDWIIPADAWSGLHASGIAGGIGNFQVAMRYMDLDNLTPLSFLDRSDVVTVEAVGVEYSREGLVWLLELTGDEVSELGQTAPVRHNQPDKAKSNRGARPRTEDWANFSAALAVIAIRDGLPKGTAAAKVYEAVGAILTEHGLYKDSNPLSLDSVRDAILLAQDWASE